MAYEQRQQAAVSSVLAWLEDELRETKAQVGRLQQGLDQSSGQIRELSTHVYSVQDLAASLAPRLDTIPPIAQQLAQLRDRASTTEEQTRTAEYGLGEALRMQQVETERLRQELNGTYRRIEILERTIEGWGNRFESLEETDRRIQDAAVLARQRIEDQGRQQESFDARLGRNAEMVKRYEHELGRLTVEIESLQKQDALAVERVQVYAEMIRRLEERADRVEAEVTSQREIFERLDLLRAELHRLEDRISLVETADKEHVQQIDDHRHVLSLLDGKDRGLTERLALLSEELSEYRTLVSEQFQRLHVVLDRQKRRQIEDLERDLRELKVSAFRPREEGGV